MAELYSPIRPAMEAHYWYRSTNDEQEPTGKGLKAVEMMRVYLVKKEGRKSELYGETMRYLCPLYELAGQWSKPMYPP